MGRGNDDVEEVLLEFADLLSIVSEDRFKARAYEKAARAVGGFPGDVSSMDLKQVLAIPSVGKSIGEKVCEFVQTGTIADLEELRAQIPAGVREMMSIPGLGPKKAMAVYSELGVSSVEDLLRAIESDSVAGLKGFGKKTQDNILAGLERLSSSGGRIPIAEAMAVAESLLATVESVPGVTGAAYAGSLRRMRETTGDIDLLVAADDPRRVMEAIRALPRFSSALASGETKSTFMVPLRKGREIQVDLRVIDRDAWGAALIYFTGSKEHNVRIRELAVREGLKLSEYGLFDASTDELLVADTEESVYRRLGLPWIPPTMRENKGEVEEGLKGNLLEPVQERDVRGDLHTHTKLTDGLHTLEDMVAHAASRGYSYYAITDHAPDLAMQRMTDEKVLQQREEIQRLQELYPKMRLLQGSELNIGLEGDVDWGPEFLAGFDVTVASVHSHFKLSRDEQTRRVIRAIENPYVNIIGHLTGRKVGARAPIDLDFDAVFEAAARTGTAIEINSHPDRLDIKDEHIAWAKRYGVRFAIDTDAHATGHLDLLRYGIGTAQRGWVTPEEVINCWPWSKLKTFLRKGRPA